MEAILPIMLGNCRHVDSFHLRIGPSQLSIHSYQVLNWENRQHVELVVKIDTSNAADRKHLRGERSPITREIHT